MTFLVAKIGIVSWPEAKRATVLAWAAGNAPATWQSWKSMQGVERIAFQIIAERAGTRPKVMAADGTWIVAPHTARERAIERRMVEKAKKTRNANRKRKAAEAIASLPDNVVQFPGKLRAPKRRLA